MGMLRRHDANRIEVFFFFQQLAKIDKSGAAIIVVLAPFLGIITLDDFLAHLPSGTTAAVALAPGWVF